MKSTANAALASLKQKYSKLHYVHMRTKANWLKAAKDLADFKLEAEDARELYDLNISKLEKIVLSQDTRMNSLFGQIADLQAENNLLVATSGAGEIVSLKRQLGVATQNMAEAYKSEKKAKRAFSIATGLYLGFAVASLVAHYLDSLPV